MLDWLGLLWMRPDIIGMGKIRFECVRLARIIQKNRNGKDYVRLARTVEDEK